MFVQTHTLTDIHLAHTRTAQWIINPYEESLLQGFQFLNFSVWGGGRKACLSARAGKGRKGGGREREEEKGVLYNEIWNLQNIKGFCSRAAVAAEQRGGVHLFPSVSPISLFLPLLSFSPSLPLLKYLPRAGWDGGVTVREKGWEELIRRRAREGWGGLGWVRV